MIFSTQKRQYILATRYTVTPEVGQTIKLDKLASLYRRPENWETNALHLCCMLAHISVLNTLNSAIYFAHAQ